MTPANAITDYLRLILPTREPLLVVWRSNRLEATAIGAGGRKRRVSAGIDGQADIRGIYGDGKGCKHDGWCVEIEVKAPGDKQRETQRVFEHMIQSHGGLYIICEVRRKDTVAEIKTILGDKAEFTAVVPVEIEAFLGKLRSCFA